MRQKLPQKRQGVDVQILIFCNHNKPHYIVLYIFTLTKLNERGLRTGAPPSRSPTRITFYTYGCYFQNVIDQTREKEKKKKVDFILPPVGCLQWLHRMSLFLFVVTGQQQDLLQYYSSNIINNRVLKGGQMNCITKLAGSGLMDKRLCKGIQCSQPFSNYCTISLHF